MLDVASKTVFQTLSHSRSLKRLASRYGMRGRRAFARRFIAGETVEDAIAAVRQLEAQRLRHTLDHLGESVTTREGTEACTREASRFRERLWERVWKTVFDATSSMGRGCVWLRP